MIIKMINNDGLQGIVGKCFFTGKPVTVEKEQKYRFEIGGFAVSEEQARKRGFEMAYKFPTFMDRQSLGDYLADELKIKRHLPLFMELYSLHGQNLDAVHETKLKVQHPGSVPTEELIRRYHGRGEKVVPVDPMDIDSLPVTQRTYYADGTLQSEVRTTPSGGKTERFFPLKK